MKKKLLYIKCNSKPDELSSSKIVASSFIERFLNKNPDFEVEEVDLYKEHIPQLKYEYFSGRSALVSNQALKQLDDSDQREIKRINDLCEQFINSRVYVIAAPMWSLGYPAPLKEYFDCVIQDKKTITFENKKPKGLLNDLDRSMIYVQSSGGKIPSYSKPILNKGLNHIKSLSKAIGIKKFSELLVDGTGTTKEEQENSINKAKSEIDKIIKNLKY